MRQAGQRRLFSGILSAMLLKLELPNLEAEFVIFIKSNETLVLIRTIFHT